jgi:membrane protease YdiL (CAAX protease family)
LPDVPNDSLIASKRSTLNQYRELANMNSNNDVCAQVQTMKNSPSELLASPKHTLGLMAIILSITVAGAINASHSGGGDHSGAPASSTQMIGVFLFMIGLEWAWVLSIYRGMKDYAGSIWDFVGRKTFVPKQLGADVVFAALALVLIYACGKEVHSVFDPVLVSPESNPILPSLPQGFVAITLWLCLSMSAGICEEIVFRGYLQRQLTAITGNAGIAILAQAVIFGVGHAYEGVGAVIAIIVHGLILGLLAHWRGNIRAGMLEHSAWDILAGLRII